MNCAQLLNSFLENYEIESKKEFKNIKTDICEISDDYRLITLSGMPGIGKSALAIQTAIQLAQQNVHVAYFTYEMSPDTVLTRIISNILSIDKTKIQRRLIAASQITKELSAHQITLSHIYIYTSRDKSKIRADIENIVNDSGIKHPKLFLFFDYLQKMQVKDENDPRIKVECNLNFINQVICDYKCQSLVISSMNRSAYENGGLGAAKDSGQVEYDTDLDLQMKIVKYNNAKKDYETVPKSKISSELARKKAYIKVSCEKNRHNETFDKTFLFYMETQKFILLNGEVSRELSQKEDIIEDTRETFKLPKRRHYYKK